MSALLAALAAALLVATPSAPAEQAHGEAEAREVTLRGDVTGSFPAGALHAADANGADLAVRLAAGRLHVEHVWAEYLNLLPAGDRTLANTDATQDRGREHANFTEARLTLEGLRDAEVLVFTPAEAWGAEAPGTAYELDEPRAEARMTLVEPRRIVQPPPFAQKEHEFGEAYDFTFDLPREAFRWSRAPEGEPTHAVAQGAFAVYVWGATVRLESAQGTREWPTGHRVVEEPAPRLAGESPVYRDRYAYVVLRPGDGRLDLTAEPGRLRWYAPQPVLHVIGAVEGAWQEASLESEQARYDGEGEGRMEGDLVLAPEGGGRFVVSGDLRATSFPATPAPQPAENRLPLVEQGILAAFALLGSVTAVLAWRSRRRRPAAGLVRPVPHPAAEARRVRAEPTKELVLRTIEERPGIHLSALAVVLRIHRSLAFHHVRDLTRRGLVYAVPLDGRHALFRAGRVPEGEARARAALAAPRTAAVAETLLATPGATIQFVADRVAASPRAAARELQRLREAGLALRDMLAHPAKFYASEALRRLRAGVPAREPPGAPPVPVDAGGTTPPRPVIVPSV